MFCNLSVAKFGYIHIGKAFMNQENQVLLRQEGKLGIITLNRPEVLNALSLDMVRVIASALKKWEGDDSIQIVMFEGAGDKAFCSGGDMKSFYRMGMRCRRGEIDIRIPRLFLGEEYSLVKQIFHYSKPTVAIMNGITMGGGYGIAGHCQYRIVTENTVMAMPEVKIGFFPDVGSVFHLSRTPHNFGRFLAITGEAVGSGDVLISGLADFYLNSSGLDRLVDALSNDGLKAAAKIWSKKGPSGGVFKQHRKVIEKAFCSFDLNKICSILEKNRDPWAKEIASKIGAVSPLSAVVTARFLKKMEGEGLDTVLSMDYQLAQKFIASPDLYEGIRAVLIEKDSAARWNPPTIGDVDEQDVEAFFKCQSPSLEDVQIFT